ncbi:MAG TPA: hypothetical protein G4N99_03095 [Thermoflexia bacterium]|nr:hypothetical protein [Thermoflexia bacterium]
MGKLTALVLCMACLLMAGCQSQNELTASGSDEWSRGIIVGSTEADPVAVATWEETTFVAWIAESGRVQLAQLDAALGLESVTDLALTTAYPYNNMLLEAEAKDRIHVVWLDSIEGARTIIHALLTPGKVEPAFQQEIHLPERTEHIQFVVRLEAQRLEIFWSADERYNSGIYHQAVSLTGDGATPPVQLTETGWQPGVGWDQSGAMRVTWLEKRKSNHFAVWSADFDPEEQLLDNSSSITQVRVKRGHRFLGPAIGSAGSQTVAAWAVGWRLSVGRGRSLNPPGSSTGERPLTAGLSKIRGTAYSITSDRGQYAIVPSTPLEGDAPIYPLTTDQIVEIWQAPRMRTVGDRAWAFFSAWTAHRGDVRMQVVVVPFDENGVGEPVAVTKTRPSSVWPDLAVSADNTLRTAWVEPLGNDMYRVVVASTAPEAREALGGFRLAEVWDGFATFVFENISLLGYAPYVLGWAVLPLGLLLLATFSSPSGVRGWQAVLWLIGAIILQLVSKSFLAPQMLPFESGPEGIALSVAPVLVGIVLMWVYWWRAKEPLLLAAYGLFIGTDAAFSVFVMVPRLLWAAGT